MSETKTISLRITLSFDRQLRIAAAQQDLSRSAFIRQTLNRQLVELSESSGDSPQQQRTGGGNDE